MVKNPPNIKIIHLGEVHDPEFEFLRVRHMKMKLEYPNQEQTEPFVYDHVERKMSDVSAIIAYDTSGVVPRIWLRSCVRPNLAQRYPEVDVFEGASTWEIPAGLIDEGESPQEAAFRELKEETGFEAPQVQLLGNPLWGSVGSMTEILWFFSVDVTGVTRGIPSEDGSPLEKHGECILVSLDEAIGISDCKTDIGIERLARKLKYVIKDSSYIDKNTT